MSPADGRAVLLRAECLRDWRVINTLLDRARGSDPSLDGAQAALVALSLDHAYQAFETILLRLERSMGLPERTGPNWHAALLADAALALPGLRPPLFPPEALGDWDGLLRFRHFLRHAYVVDLDADKLLNNAARLGRAVAATEPWIEAVFESLAPSDG